MVMMRQKMNWAQHNGQWEPSE